jgi:tRNA nucleotidyltransferase (CCA-adding enzyme)
MKAGNRRLPGKRLESLRRRAGIVTLSRLAARRGIAAWIVGGAVRDQWLGISPAEIDLAVSHDAEGLASDLEREGGGRAVFLSQDRPGPRVFRVAGKRPLDLAEIEGGSIEADLGRRDFTVNAIAVALGTGKVLDPFGGLADLASLRLRCVRVENLSEDPLRILRAARLHATHGLRPDRATLAAARQASALFGRAAAERVGAELSKLLGSDRAAAALAWAARAGILAATLGLDLSVTRAAALARSLAVLDDTATRRLTPERRRRLRLALLAVRLGLDPAAARRWLAERRWSRQEAQDVARLVTLAALARGLRTREDHWRWILEAGPLWRDGIALLTRLGASGRRRARALVPLGLRPRRRLAVTGDDVVRWLGIPPGPVVGELLARLEIAAAMGEVENRREARHWLTGQLQDRPVTGYNH